MTECFNLARIESVNVIIVYLKWAGFECNLKRKLYHLQYQFVVVFVTEGLSDSSVSHKVWTYVGQILLESQNEMNLV